MKKIEIIAELHELEAKLDSNIQQPALSLPANYFETLPGIVLDKIKEQNNTKLEQDELPEILKQFNRATPYQVPENYFETSESKPTGKKASVVNISFKNITRWMAAAVITGMIGTASLIYWGLQSPDVNKDPNAWVKSTIKSETDESLNEFINLNAEQGLNTADSKAVASNSDAKELLKDVSDNEISAIVKDAEPLLSKQEVTSSIQEASN
jgi:hypothetical protein